MVGCTRRGRRYTRVLYHGNQRLHAHHISSSCIVLRFSLKMLICSCFLATNFITCIWLFGLCLWKQITITYTLGCCNFKAFDKMFFLRHIQIKTNTCCILYSFALNVLSAIEHKVEITHCLHTIIYTYTQLIVGMTFMFQQPISQYDFRSVVTFGGWNDDLMIVVNQLIESAPHHYEHRTEKLLFILPKYKVQPQSY